MSGLVVSGDVVSGRSVVPIFGGDGLSDARLVTTSCGGLTRKSFWTSATSNGAGLGKGGLGTSAGGGLFVTSGGGAGGVTAATTVERGGLEAFTAGEFVRTVAATGFVGGGAVRAAEATGFEETVGGFVLIGAAA